MAVRNIRVIGDRMEPRRIYAGTRGSYITEVAFTFSGEWDGLTKKLIFYPVRGKPVYINYTYGSEKIPYEVMRYSGDAIMLMSGYSVEPDGSLGVKIVTASAFVAVDPAESDTQNEPDIPEATEFEKIVAKLGAPYIGENGNWFVWDVYTHEFVDTGLPARGEQGETGRGLTILGKYGSLDDLRASVKDAQPGDAYAVGEKAPYTIYIWDEVTGDFTNHGDLRGVGITKIEQITDNTGSGEPNTIRIVTDDGAEYDYTVYNGERGHPGNIWIGETEPPDDSYTIWLNPGGAVSGFLESHQGTENAGRVLVVGEDGIVRPGEAKGSVELDTTLTQSRKAADAKAVGDKLAEKIPAPATASVGQTIKVSAVDENGKPTAWEAVDLAKSYEYLIDLTEDVESIDFDFTDSEGNPIMLNEILIVLHIKCINRSGCDTTLKYRLDNGADKTTTVTNNYANAEGNWLLGSSFAKIQGKTIYCISNKNVHSNGSTPYSSTGTNGVGLYQPHKGWGDRWMEGNLKPIGITGVKIPGAMGAKSQIYIYGVKV